MRTMKIDGLEYVLVTVSGSEEDDLEFARLPMGIARLEHGCRFIVDPEGTLPNQEFIGKLPKKTVMNDEYEDGLALAFDTLDALNCGWEYTA